VMPTISFTKFAPFTIPLTRYSPNPPASGMWPPSFIPSGSLLQIRPLPLVSLPNLSPPFFPLQSFPLHLLWSLSLSVWPRCNLSSASRHSTEAASSMRRNCNHIILFIVFFFNTVFCPGSQHFHTKSGKTTIVIVR
jgi:hypothetical protein